MLYTYLWLQGTIMGGINKRNGLIMNTTLSEDGSGIVIQADVPLAQVFYIYFFTLLYFMLYTI